MKNFPKEEIEKLNAYFLENYHYYYTHIIVGCTVL